MGDTGAVEEHKWNFEHKGDDTKADMVASAADTLTAKMKELFRADGQLAQIAKARERGPEDFARRRHRSVRLNNGDQNRESPWLPVIVVLLLVAIVGGVVVLFQLHAIQEGQSDHERRIYQLERNRSAGHAPS